MIAFGLDLGGTKIEAAALSSGGAFLARVRVPTPGAYEAGLEAAAEVLAEPVLVENPSAAVADRPVPEPTDVGTDLIGEQQFAVVGEAQLDLKIH